MNTDFFEVAPVHKQLFVTQELKLENNVKMWLDEMGCEM